MKTTKIPAVVIVTVIALSLAGCGSSSTVSSAARSSSSSASVANVESSNMSTSSSSTEKSTSTENPESTSSSAQAETVFGTPQKVKLLSGDGSNVVGTSSNFRATQSDCTEENLAIWYNEYVKNSDDNFCVILFTDKPGYGVNAIGDIIEVGVKLEKDENDGSYSSVSTDNSVLYVPNSSGNGLSKIE